MNRIGLSLVFVLIAVPCFAAGFHLSSPVLKDKATIATE